MEIIFDDFKVCNCLRVDIRCSRVFIQTINYPHSVNSYSTAKSFLINVFELSIEDNITLVKVTNDVVVTN